MQVGSALKKCLHPGLETHVDSKMQGSFPAFIVCIYERLLPGAAAKQSQYSLTPLQNSPVNGRATLAINFANISIVC
jgi:hypothetical protein